MNLRFIRSKLTLRLEMPNGLTMAFPASNFTDSRSEGPLPDGEYPFVSWRYTGEPEEGSVGPIFILFDASAIGREEIGLHAGHQGEKALGKKDGFGRGGWKWCTFGCVRSTPGCLQEAVRIHKSESGIKALIVQENDLEA